MTTTTRARSVEPRLRRGARSRAFTLVEILVGATLGSMLLAAVLAAFLFLGRAGVGLQNYADMEAEAREAVETFAQDARMASGVVWNSASSLTLSVARPGGALSVSYDYNSTAGTLVRRVGSTSTTLLTGISTFAFSAYSIDTQAVSLASNLSAANGATKQIQLTLETRRAHRTLAIATNKVVSARFVLRNKPVGA